jgi:uncharacterized membrane protein
MFFRAPEAHSRSILKAISWRILGSIDTFVISFFVTGKLTFALSIASVETFTKIALYYFHERAWAMVPFGRPKLVVEGQPVPLDVVPPAAATLTSG